MGFTWQNWEISTLLEICCGVRPKLIRDMLLRGKLGVSWKPVRAIQKKRAIFFNRESGLVRSLREDSRGDIAVRDCGKAGVSSRLRRVTLLQQDAASVALWMQTIAMWPP